MECLKKNQIKMNSVFMLFDLNKFIDITKCSSGLDGHLCVIKTTLLPIHEIAEYKSKQKITVALVELGNACK